MKNCVLRRFSHPQVREEAACYQCRGWRKVGFLTESASLPAGKSAALHPCLPEPHPELDQKLGNPVPDRVHEAESSPTISPVPESPPNIVTLSAGSDCHEITILRFACFELGMLCGPQRGTKAAREKINTLIFFCRRKLKTVSPLYERDMLPFVHDNAARNGFVIARKTHRMNPDKAMELFDKKKVVQRGYFFVLKEAMMNKLAPFASLSLMLSNS